MLDLLLHPAFLPAVLAVLAVATPVAARVLALRRPGWRGRPLTACGLLGPLALALWGFHELVLAVVGFDAALSALLVLAAGLATGLALGEWARRGG